MSGTGRVSRIKPEPRTQELVLHSLVPHIHLRTQARKDGGMEATHTSVAVCAASVLR